MSLWDQLKRRKVIRVAIAYLVTAWVIIQVVSTLNDPLNLPDLFDTVVVVFLAICFPIVLIFAWVFQITPQGIRRDNPESLPPPPPPLPSPGDSSLGLAKVPLTRSRTRLTYWPPAGKEIVLL